MSSPRPPAPSDGPPDRLTLLAFAVIVVFLGMNFVAVRFSNRELAPFWGAGTRFAIAAGILLAIVFLRRIPLPRGRALAGAVLFGLLNFGLTYALLYRALVTVPAGLASVLFATVPLTTLLMANAIGLEAFRWRALAGALVVLTGVAAIFRGQLTLGVPLPGIIALVGGSLAIAASGIVVKRFPRSHPFAMNAVAMCVGAILLLSGAFAAGEPLGVPALAATWIAFGWLVASSIVAFVLMVWVIGRWTASGAAYGGVLAPVVTLVAAAVLAGETPSPTLLGGGLLVLVGVYVGALAPPRGGKEAPSAVVPAAPAKR